MLENVLLSFKVQNNLKQQRVLKATQNFRQWKNDAILKLLGK